AISPAQVNLTWIDNSNNEAGFKVLRKRPADLDFVDLMQLAAGTTAYADTKVTTATPYTYKVRSFSDAGGAPSNDANVTTPPAPPASTTPSPYTTLFRSAISPAQVNLTWIDNSNNEAGFKVLRKRPADLDFVDLMQLA